MMTAAIYDSHKREVNVEEHVQYDRFVTVLTQLLPVLSGFEIV